MEYKVIPKSQGGRITHTDVHEPKIGIGRSYITLLKGFNEKYPDHGNWITYGESEDGCLCFKITKEEEFDSYHFHNVNKAMINAGVHMPKKIRNRIIRPGKYLVSKDGDWYVTSCKLYEE